MLELKTVGHILYISNVYARIWYHIQQPASHVSYNWNI